ncbi:unnamed protein product [Schistosoma rodhaini]|uniref:Uncharacterized protein n=1 Tax=Schistosoma rodhaini TaxID=6188 RepID=A0AA85FHU9_9TREM|nr:unnamed protein product [Schistosoma rodhaini]
MFIRDLATSHLTSETEVYQGIYVINDHLYNRQQLIKTNSTYYTQSIIHCQRVFQQFQLIIFEKLFKNQSAYSFILF